MDPLLKFFVLGVYIFVDDGVLFFGLPLGLVQNFVDLASGFISGLVEIFLDCLFLVDQLSGLPLQDFLNSCFFEETLLPFLVYDILIVILSLMVLDSFLDKKEVTM